MRYLVFKFSVCIWELIFYGFGVWVEVYKDEV